LTEWLKLAPRYVFAVCFATGILLVARPSDLATLGLEQFMNQYRSWFGVAFVASISLLLAHAGATGFGWVRKEWRWRRHLVHGRRRLRELTSDEREILARYLENDTRAQFLAVSCGVTAGLADAGIIYRSANLSSTDGISFAYNIQPWAWDQLREHPELVEAAGNES